VKTAVTVTAREVSSTAAKFGAGGAAGITVTHSPIVSSIAADTSCIAARQSFASGNNVIAVFL
jgi:hypothetical protein